MPKSGLFVITLISLAGLVISSNVVRAATIHECNTMYNSCSGNCDKYAPNAGSAASCISNCGAKAQSCHNTASDRPKGKAMTVAPPRPGSIKTGLSETTKAKAAAAATSGPPKAGLVSDTGSSASMSKTNTSKTKNLTNTTTTIAPATTTGVSR